MKTTKIHLMRRWSSCVMLLLLASCDLFEYHPYDTQNFDMTAVNATNIAKMEQQNESSDTLRFVFAGDTQRDYDETEDFVEEISLFISY